MTSIQEGLWLCFLVATLALVSGVLAVPLIFRTVSAFFLLVTWGISWAAVTYPIGQLDPLAQTPSATVGGSPNSLRGWEFTAKKAITVSTLSASVPAALGCSIKLELWDSQAQNVIAATTISAPGNSTWTSGSVTPVNLTQGQKYVVTAFSATCGSWYYYWGSAPAAFLPDTNEVQYERMLFSNGGDVFPTAEIANAQYGVPDIGFSLAAVLVPVPTLAEWSKIFLMILIAFVTMTRPGFTRNSSAG